MKETTIMKEKVALVLAKIMKVCTSIGMGLVCFIALILIITGVWIPFVSNNIKISDGEINAFNYKLNYSANAENNSLTFTHKKDSYTIELDDNVFKDANLNAVKIYNKINNIKIGKLVAIIETVIVGSFITIGILYFILKNMKKILNNIIEEKTPFNVDNVVILRNIIKLLVISFVVEIVFDLVLVIFSEMNLSVISVFDLFELFIIYLIAWGIEKGTLLKKEKKVDE